MNTEPAIELINNITYRPGWIIEAVDYHLRHEGAVLVRVQYQTSDYSEEYAPEYGPAFTVAYFATLVPAHYPTELDLLRIVFDKVQLLESHENREAFRVKRDDRWEGPFNPHEPTGQHNYGTADHDISFGDLGLGADWMFNQMFDNP